MESLPNTLVCSQLRALRGCTFLPTIQHLRSERHSYNFSSTGSSTHASTGSTDASSPEPISPNTTSNEEFTFAPAKPLMLPAEYHLDYCYHLRRIRCLRHSLLQLLSGFLPLQTILLI